MEHILESAIGAYLAAGGDVSLIPQYAVEWDEELREGGSCPDFVVIDHKRKHVVVVEVSGAADLGALLRKVEDRKTRWFQPLMRSLRDLGTVNDSWPPRFLGFVRRAGLEKANKRFASEGDVCFVAIEECTFPWLYWENRLKQGLPLKGS